VNDLEVRYIFTKDGYYSRVTYACSDTLLDFLIVSQSWWRPSCTQITACPLSVIIACRHKSLLAVYTSVESHFLYRCMCTTQFHGFICGLTVFGHVASTLSINSWISRSKRWLSTTTSALCSCSWLYQCVRGVVTLEMTAQTMSFRYELACKGHSTEKAQDLVT